MQFADIFSFFSFNEKVEGAEDFVMGTFLSSECQSNALTVERSSRTLADTLGSRL
jgi:hypothetical protein